MVTHRTRLTSCRTKFSALAACASLLAATPASAAPNLLDGTIAHMTWPEVERSAKSGAVALWAIGSIEEHGPHLPLATDAYVPSLELQNVRKILQRQRIRAEIVPPFYWGVNQVTGAFPGSIEIRPEVMSSLLQDVFRSLGRAGFKKVFIITGHYDAAHSVSIANAVRAANADIGPRVTYVVPVQLAQRAGIACGEEGFAAVLLPMPGKTKFPDLHAGRSETSMMLHGAPGLVRSEQLKSLPPTDLSGEQVAEWRRGQEHARLITPQGYLGAPAVATARRGGRQLNGDAKAYAAVIASLVQNAFVAAPCE
jgi:creatinine amidohydrolase